MALTTLCITFSLWSVINARVDQLFCEDFDTNGMNGWDTQFSGNPSLGNGGSIGSLFSASFLGTSTMTMKGSIDATNYINLFMNYSLDNEYYQSSVDSFYAEYSLNDGQNYLSLFPEFPGIYHNILRYFSTSANGVSNLKLRFRTDVSSNQFTNAYIDDICVYGTLPTSAPTTPSPTSASPTTAKPSVSPSETPSKSPVTSSPTTATPTVDTSLHLIYSDNMTDSSKWDVISIGSGVIFTSADCGFNGDNCLRIGVQGIMSTTISTIGYRGIRIFIDVREDLVTSEEECYLRYKTPEPDWVYALLASTRDGTKQDIEVIVPNNILYNNQASFEIQLVNSAVSGESKYCYFDDLRVYGFVYVPTKAPTFYPTSSMQSTLGPSASPTQRPTVTDLSTNNPTSPTIKAVDLSTMSPSNDGMFMYI